MKTSVKYCLLLCILLSFRLSYAQFNIKAGAALTNQYIDEQLQHTPVKPYVGLEIFITPLTYKRSNSSFIIGEVYYTQKGSLGLTTTVEPPRYNAYGFSASFVYRFKRYPRSCLSFTRWGYFRPYVKVGVGVELLHSKTIEKNSTAVVALPRIAVGNLIAIIKRRPLEFEIGFSPQLYPITTNGYKVNNISTSVTLNFPLIW